MKSATFAIPGMSGHNLCIFLNVSPAIIESERLQQTYGIEIHTYDDIGIDLLDLPERVAGTGLFLFLSESIPEPSRFNS